MNRKLALLVPALGAAILLLTAADNEHATWSYSGETGPLFWGELDPAYVLCKTGTTQSPIDITGAESKEGSPLEFHYETSTMNVINNGHTIQQNYDPGSFVIYNSKRFNLKQFHFHRKSEHTVEGKHFAMEMHLVHVAGDGELLVVGVLLKPGPKSEFLSHFWPHLPGKAGVVAKSENVTIDINKALPENSALYSYKGSLTTPPGSEGVNWFVFAEPQTISVGQAIKFYRLYPHNYRPVQPLNDREISIWNP